MKLPIYKILRIRAVSPTELEAEWIGELILCKDCRKKYVRQLDNKIFCQRTARAVDPDDYCSKGELKDVGY